MIVAVPAFTPTSLPPEIFTYFVFELLRVMPEAAPSSTVPLRLALVSPTISFIELWFSVSFVGAFFTSTRHLTEAPLWAVITMFVLPALTVVIAPVSAFTMTTPGSSEAYVKLHIVPSGYTPVTLRPVSPMPISSASGLALISVGAGSTVSLQVPLLPFCGTQAMTAVPAAWAVITPLRGSTVATDSSLE